MRILLSAAVLLASYGAQANDAAIQTEDDRISYSVGHQVAGDLHANGVKINGAVLLRAIEDALANAKPAMSEEDMRATLVAFKRKMAFADKQKKQQNAEQQHRESLAFMTENAKREGVATTPSGLQYHIIQQGTGKMPQAGDYVTVNYRGLTTDNQEFDNSARRGKPARFKLDKVMRGWTEGLQLLKEGGKITLFIPPGLGMTERNPLAERALIYEIELLSIEAAAPGENTGSTSTDAKLRKENEEKANE